MAAPFTHPNPRSALYDPLRALLLMVSRSEGGWGQIKRARWGQSGLTFPAEWLLKRVGAPDSMARSGRAYAGPRAGVGAD
jgi:hypothetical protein